MSQKKVSIALVLSLLLSITIFSQSVEYEDLAGQELNSILYAVPFLTIAPDSRASGMGDIGVATSPDVNSQHWNPAKYPFIETGYGFCISYTPWLKKIGIDDINLIYLSGFYRFDKRQTLSTSLRYFSLGSIIFTDNYGNELPITGQPNEFSIDAAYSRALSNNFSMSVAFRYIRSDLSNNVQVGEVETSAGNQFAVDVSSYYHKKIKLNTYDGKIAFGTNISNVGGKITYTEKTDGLFLPINLRVGSALTVDLDPYNSLTVSVDLNKFLVPTPTLEIDTTINGQDSTIVYGIGDWRSAVPTGMLRSFYDAPGIDNHDGTRSVFREELNEINIGIGVEYWYIQQFAIRAGYFYEHKTKGNRKYFTVGLGLKYNVFGLDISYIIPQYPGNPLANTVRFSLVFNFETLGLNNSQ